MDWAGGRTEEELFSGSDRWHQEKGKSFFVGDSIVEDRFKSEQGGGCSSLSTGSKHRACDGKDRAGHEHWQGRVDTSSHRDE